MSAALSRIKQHGKQNFCAITVITDKPMGLVIVKTLHPSKGCFLTL
jgi:hypothetical protein